MKRIAGFLFAGVLSAGVALAAMAGGATAASTADGRAPHAAAPSSIRPQISDISAAARKKKRSAAHPAATGAAVAPAATYWHGADPTKGPGIDQLRQMQREGRCVIDDGYGRFSSCSNE